MKEAVKKLSKIQDENIKPKSKLQSDKLGRYEYLMSALLTLQTDLMIPITIFNPPPFIH
jgi:hypothetical protein